MVDYSKWDKMDVSESESEYDYDEPSPKVTKLDQNSKVTFGGGSNEIKIQDSDMPPAAPLEKTATSNLKPGLNIVKKGDDIINSKFSHGYTTKNNGTTNLNSTGTTSASSPSSAKKQTSSTSTLKVEEFPPEKWTANGGVVENSDFFTPNTDYYWSQSKEDVVIRVNLSGFMKENKITENSSSSSKPVNKCIKFKNYNQFGFEIENLTSKKLEFYYEIEREKEDEEDGIVDWEIESANDIKNTKFLKLTIRKKRLIANTVVWWRSFFKGGKEVDVTSMKDRNPEKVKQQMKMAEALKTATEAFSKKVKEAKKNGEIPMLPEDLGKTMKPYSIQKDSCKPCS